MERRFIVVFCFLLFGFFAAGQPVFPEKSEIYRDDVVARIDILIHPDSLQWIYDHVESDHEFPATFIFNNGTVQDTIDEIGFRLRGNTSRYSKKKSFKVSFNTFHSGRKYYGVEKMNLNGEHNDPSIIRSKLCWDILREMDIPAPYANHVEVYINGNYYGLYINVEHIDEEFVLSRFGNNDGNLYKCLYPADLTYKGSDPDDYKFMSGGRRAYELTINEEIDNYSDLRDFIQMLHTASDAEFKCKIDQYFNVYDYLKIIAFDIITANWDGYIYNKNNFYLYHNTQTGKFEYMPYDLDNTFGIDWFNIDWGTRSIYQWGLWESRPLFDRLMGITEFRNQFSVYVKVMLDSVFNPDHLYPRIDQVKQMILPSVIDDPYYPQDYGYTLADFLNSYNQSLGAHVKYGLKPYIQTRYDKALYQLLLFDAVPVINYIHHTENGLNEPVIFQVFAEDDEELSDIRVIYSVDGGVQQELALSDDGLHDDGAAGDHIWGNSLGGFDAQVQLSYQIRVADNALHISVLPCDPFVFDIGKPPPRQLVINEFMAANQQTIKDEFGQADDWIEIYNASDESVWVGDMYLSDNLGNPTKWMLPERTLLPGEFLLIWADDTPSQGETHTNYKLAKEGEEIGIFSNAESGHILMDSVTFGPQSVDISLGRVVDAAPEWKSFTIATPGAPNSAFGEPELADMNHTDIYPNPCYGDILYFQSFSHIYLFDIFGRLIKEKEYADRMEVEDLFPGIYIIKTATGTATKIVIP
ncbi:MAG: CotH kinase family protein [Bacteroidales bacterium]|nr:CotH kinase family protein [Lentimicrobiaceae bacterium]MDD5693884.1 CotH kinase family protein [Bacteroidales bacterium]